MVLQPETRLFERHSLKRSSGLVQVEPEVLYKILIANFFSIRRKTSKGQVVPTVLSHPTQVLPSTVTIAEVFGFAGLLY